MEEASTGGGGSKVWMVTTQPGRDLVSHRPPGLQSFGRKPGQGLAISGHSPSNPGVDTDIKESLHQYYGGDTF